MLYVAAAMSSGKVRIVLHHPANAENIGAVARAMMNFGLSRLVVVVPPAWGGAPRGGGDGTAQDDVLKRAARVARHATVLLDRAEFHPDLAASLGTATWVCGTTSRELPGRPRHSPRQLGEEVARRSRFGEVALVFGEEQRGLSDAELELCHAVCTIPTSPDYDSMNLAQSVAVLCYELARGDGAEARVERRPLDPDGALAPPSGPARHATVEALWGRLQVVLAAAGYLNPQNPEQILAEWRRLLTRAEPTQREVELLLAAARSLERQLRAGPAAS